MLTIEGLRLTRTHDGIARDVLQEVSLSLQAGEICALMGVSGAGKSTVLRAAVALEPFQAGRIVIDGVALTPGPVPQESALRNFRRKVGMVFQQHALFTHLTVQQNVALAPRHALAQSPAQAAEVAMALLDSLGVVHRAQAYPSQISGGEAQRVAIARALALDPPVLLMDEPTAALDPARRGALADTLRALAAQGRSLLITTHDLAFARAVADTAAVLADGVVVERGAVTQVLDTPRHEETRKLMAVDAQ
ncbi:hypothetical protein GEMMAAP_16455 [Gemmatimonas phototrophica]|uniref:ABC transporter domain-containing protein n=1 Tax=Gemmatimonas phototrophica TaxID=1379270 RepID=A0A143BPG4_9BACT|nr:hypothetical protein GEMMAAP_16455 [Gemmatimonas phototrophica]